MNSNIICFLEKKKQFESTQTRFQLMRKVMVKAFFILEHVYPGWYQGWKFKWEPDSVLASKIDKVIDSWTEWLLEEDITIEQVNFCIRDIQDNPNPKIGSWGMFYHRCIKK